MFITLKVGDRITVPGRIPPIRHHGIYAGNGYVLHACFDHGMVVETPMAQFTGGHEPRIEKRAKRGLEYVVVARARSLLGKKYDLAQWNCEHLASYAADGEATSPTARLAAGIVGLVFVGLAAANSGWDPNVGRYRDAYGRFAPNLL